MVNIRKEAIAAFNFLSKAERRHIGSDAVAVLRTAIKAKTKDGLIDKARTAALEHHGITKRPAKVEAAYHRFLTYHFLFGTEALAEHRKRRAMARGESDV